MTIHDSSLISSTGQTPETSITQDNTPIIQDCSLVPETTPISNKTLENKKEKKTKKKKKKKKKKGLIKSLMKTIMKPKSSQEIKEKQRKLISQNVGGGSFSKLNRL
tara:strand:- start:1286 stop:1603 length:318 start_codon:yes stop_codon:yes gene_type:complete